MATSRVGKDDTIQIGDWKIERRLATARIEGGGPQNVAEECNGRCCHHGVYASLPERDRILEYADLIPGEMDDTQPTDPTEWFEDETHEDEDYPGGLCIGTAVYNDKCAFLNREGLCVLQQLEPSLDLPQGERLKPFYCRLFPLTTWYSRLEFDDMCDGIRPCCTLAADGPTRVVDAWEYELTEALGKEGYQEFCGVAKLMEGKLEAEKGATP
jgi:hypothetical protein